MLITLHRGLPRLQVLAVLEPQYALPHQPRMLSQDVRVLCRPDLLIWTSTLSSCRVSQDPSQEPLPPTDLRGHRRRTRGGHSPTCDAHVCQTLKRALPTRLHRFILTNLSSLNRREEEFDTKRAYDDFLEQREEIIANLVSRTDVAKTEAQLQKYATENMQSIRANQALEEQEASSFQARMTQEQEEARLRRQAARQEYENERREMQAGREDFLTRLASGSTSDAAAIVREGHKVLLKKSSARRSEEDRIRQKQAALRGSENKRTGTPLTTADTAGTTEDTGLVKGLRRVKTPEPEKPYDPFMGLVPEKRDYVTLQQSYPSTYLDRLRSNKAVSAGGYDLREYYSRTLMEAFAGLGCFIEDEISQRDAVSSSGISKPASTEGAAMAAVGGERPAA